jgi:hypothetical protein
MDTSSDSRNAPPAQHRSDGAAHENAGAGPEALDGLEGWSQLDANVVRQLGADQFPPLPFVVVPQPKRGHGR